MKHAKLNTIIEDIFFSSNTGANASELQQSISSLLIVVCWS